jgi:selenocysteine lyase/cysteine desulfurase
MGTVALALGVSSLQSVRGNGLERAFRLASELPPDQLATDEEFWYYIQQAFTASPGIINLNNGGVSPAPKTVQEAMKRFYDYSNEAPSYYMWRILDQGREPLRKQLADIAGCSPEEIAINRNASEGLETVIFGLPLQRGDEVVASRQDYPHVVQAWKQRELRDGIKVNWVNLVLPSEDESYLATQYVNQFSPKTKVVCITHMINWNGQIIPVKKIAAEAKKRNIEVLVDGAHTFAHFDFKIPDLGADYFATSLHKWLYAPIGSGMLYVKKEKIKSLYPLFAGNGPEEDTIQKFEHLGTRPFFIEQAIGKACEFHQMMGIERKQKRLHYLKNYWMEKVKELPGIQLQTSLSPKWSGAIGMVSFDGKKPGELDNFLFNNYKIHTVTINWENISGVRVTPNVYTTTNQLDVLVEALRQYAKKV